MAEVNPARALAHRSLLKMKCGKYTNIEVNTTLQRSCLSPEDKALYTRLTYGVTERLITLDAAISQYSSTPVEKISEEALAALRMGIYQLKYCDRIPDHAAVSESVELCPKKQKGFVNAVLRAFVRADKEIKLPDNPIDRLSVLYSVPKELCRLFTEWYGDRAEAIFKAFFGEEKISLRVNTLKITAQQAAQSLSGKLSEIAEDSITVNDFSGVAEGIEKGLWFVQDEASSLCVQTLGCKPGELFVDTCAAPGGKTFAAAIAMENRGRVVAFDIHKNKLSLISSGAKKLGLTVVETAQRDAREPDSELFGKADRVLCDAPCSGLGVIGKKPDIKYKDTADIERLPKIQSAVLSGAALYVKEGGTLVYSTCTLNPLENEGVCESFLSENPDFELCSMRTLFPDTDNTDGFFICKMRRREVCGQ